MPDLLCKTASQPGLTMTVGNLGAHFLHGSSTMVFKGVEDCEMWCPVTNKKLDKVRKKKQAEVSVGEPPSNVCAPEGHITVNSVKPHTGLYETQSQNASNKLTNKDMNMKKTKNKMKNKKKTMKNKTKKTKQTSMNPKFEPDMLNMKDMNQFVQQLSHLLVLWDIQNQTIDKTKAMTKTKTKTKEIPTKNEISKTNKVHSNTQTQKKKFDTVLQKWIKATKMNITKFLDSAFDDL